MDVNVKEKEEINDTQENLINTNDGQEDSLDNSNDLIEDKNNKEE